MALSDILNFAFLAPKISKNHFFLEKWPQNLNFSKISKNRNICCRASGPQPVCKVSTQYDNFDPQKGCFLSSHSAQWWRHTFKCNFLIVISHLQENYGYHWIADEILLQKHVFVFKKKNFLKIWPFLNFLTWPWIDFHIFSFKWSQIVK